MFRRLPAALHAALAVTLLLAGVAPFSDEAYAQGNSAAAARCQQGGYLLLVRIDGTPFKNTGDCVHYLQQGGLVLSTAATLVVSPSPVPLGTPWSNVSFTGSGFIPNNPLLLTLTEVPSGFNVGTQFNNFSVGPAGTFTLPGFVWSTNVSCSGYNGLLRLTASDGYNQASVTFQTPC
jgi:hypothetical protein